MVSPLPAMTIAGRSGCSAAWVPGYMGRHRTEIVRVRAGRLAAMALAPQLLEILACPQDKGPLLYFADEDALYNPRLHRRYAVRDDIPVMLIDEATTVED